MKHQAIASCRVSTHEQLLNNSLNRQEKSVIKAAEELDVEIVKWWSGDVSSKAGTNINRKDLNEMLEYCRANPDVRYLLVDEPDRFMRSIDEAFYFEVTFRKIGVQVWYASDPQLNNGDLMAKMLKFTKYLPAEGSNEERQRKSISGQTQAIKEGRYPFHPKPGYMKGSDPGVHIPEPGTFDPLKEAFKQVLSDMFTPQEALKRLNKSSFGKRHAKWRMDKFSEFACDPYYAGVVEINKQVKARNEHGLHQPMLTLEEHQQLVSKLTGRAVPRGPRNQYNPRFPMSKILLCADCGAAKFTGSRKNNGKNKKVTRYYEKYHCRNCRKEFDRIKVHLKVMGLLTEAKIKAAQRNDFIRALRKVWTEKEKDRFKQLEALHRRIRELEQEKSDTVRELVKIDAAYKQDLIIEIDRIKDKISSLKEEVEDIGSLDEKMADFVEFGINYSDKLANDWWRLSHEDRVRCQQLIFPGGIYLKSDGKVGTNGISPIYRLGSEFESKKPLKKLTEVNRSSMVELPGIAPGSEK